MDDYIAMLKRNHMCTRCHKQDAYTLGGRALCSDCAEYYRLHRKKYYANHKDAIADRIRTKRSDCINKKICVSCMKRKTDDKFKVCSICRKKKNAREKSKRLYQYGDVWCRSCRQLLDGQLKLDGTPSKLCSSCYTRIATLGAEIFKKYWKSRKESKNGN